MDMSFFDDKILIQEAISKPECNLCHSESNIQELKNWQIYSVKYLV
jgi:hypothetical protein